MLSAAKKIASQSTSALRHGIGNISHYGLIPDGWVGLSCKSLGYDDLK